MKLNILTLVIVLLGLSFLGNPVPQDAVVVSIQDIAPIYRDLLFRDNDEGTARERVVSVLNGFRVDATITPIQIADAQRPHKYKLTHGVHRLYCSIAVGFTHIPTVPGLDWDTIPGVKR